jgi:hypothetical protein
MQHGNGHAAWKWICSMDMDMQHGHGHATWTWTSSMDMDTNMNMAIDYYWTKLNRLGCYDMKVHDYVYTDIVNTPAALATLLVPDPVTAVSHRSWRYTARIP